MFFLIKISYQIIFNELEITLVQNNIPWKANSLHEEGVFEESHGGTEHKRHEQMPMQCVTRAAKFPDGNLSTR